MTNNAEYELRELLGLEADPMEPKSGRALCEYLLRYCTAQELTAAIRLMQQEPGNPAYVAFLRDMRSKLGSQNGNHQRETT